MDRWMIGLCFKGCEVLARAVLELCWAAICEAMRGCDGLLQGCVRALEGCVRALVGCGRLCGVGQGCAGALTDCDGLCEAVQGGAMLCRAVLRGSAAEL